MNLLDLGILILLGLVTIRGYFRGLFQELAVLVGLVAGVLVAAHAYLRLAAYLTRWIGEPYARIIAFVVILIAVYWLTRLVAHLLQRLLVHLYLDFFDRLFGSAFALVKGALLIGFGLILISLALPQHTRLIKESRLAPQLTSFARQSLELLPQDFKQRVNDYLQDWLKRGKRDFQGSEGGVGQELESLKRSLEGLGKQDETKVENGRPGEKAPAPAPSPKPKFLTP
jgi:membrane protein required for colicin V production